MYNMPGKQQQLFPSQPENPATAGKNETPPTAQRTETSPPLPYGLRYGSTTYIATKDSYTGDFSHCPREDIERNAEILREIFRRVAPNFSKFRPWGITKDYDKGLYLYCSDHVPNAPVVEEGIRISEMGYERFVEYDTYGEPVLPMPTDHSPLLQGGEQPTVNGAFSRKLSN